MLLSRRRFTAGCLVGLATSTARAMPPPTDYYKGTLSVKPLPGQLRELRSGFAYVEAPGRVWSVPQGAVVDGASIPRVFWPVVGKPWDGTYVDAAIVHDWYCAVRVQPWRDTHKMFYHAMLRSGVKTAKARLMFLAVYFGGPSWDDLTIANMRLLTKNGALRPPGAPPKSRTKFAFDTHVAFDTPDTAERARWIDAFAAAQQDTDKLRNKLSDLLDTAERRNLDVNAMTKLVEQAGREEKTATLLQEAGDWSMGGGEQE